MDGGKWISWKAEFLSYALMSVFQQIVSRGKEDRISLFAKSESKISNFDVACFAPGSHCVLKENKKSVANTRSRQETW